MEAPSHQALKIWQAAAKSLEDQRWLGAVEADDNDFGRTTL
jgi:hypothetical protein